MWFAAVVISIFSVNPANTHTYYYLRSYYFNQIYLTYEGSFFR